jgi:uncharacterized repeat protein (TIGR04138 family)
MQKRSFDEALDLILKEDHRYAAEAYLFVRAGLDFTIKLYSKPDSGPARHVSGRELLEGLRQFALQEFGPMAFTVLKTWGVGRTDDFGEIVFNLVGKGVLGKTPDDRKEDFAGGYEFEAAFVQPFRPSKAAKAHDQPAGHRSAPGRRAAPHREKQ